MSSFDIYTFTLCFIVFVLLTALFSYIIVYITKLELKMIRHGLRDQEFLQEDEKKRRQGCAQTVFGRVLSVLLSLVLCAALFFAIYIKQTDDRAANGIPSIKVVKSDSMAEKNKKNTYLVQNNLDDQIQMFDVIICHHLPPEEELELYDIVVYQLDSYYLVHRIVGIEEPNEAHPNERLFTLQGDAVDGPDRSPVKYSQMKGIYTGDRIPFAGSIVLFFQSPSGWLCILLVLFATISEPIITKKLSDEKKKRLALLNADKDDQDNSDDQNDQNDHTNKDSDVVSTGKS